MKYILFKNTDNANTILGSDDRKEEEEAGSEESVRGRWVGCQKTSLQRSLLNTTRLNERKNQPDANV